MTKKLLCCDVFKEELLALGLPPDMEVEFLSMGLHLHPAKLHAEIQAALDRTTGYSLVILGFGLCGGALKGIKAPDCPLVMPREHDCIPVLLGSKAKYQALQQEDWRTFYFSGGWVEGDRMIIPEYERSIEKFGPKKALRIQHMLFENYNRLLYIHTGHPRGPATLDKTKAFAGTLQLPCLETAGGTDYLQKLIHGPWQEGDFLTIPAGGTVAEAEFLRDGYVNQVQGC